MVGGRCCKSATVLRKVPLTPQAQSPTNVHTLAASSARTASPKSMFGLRHLSSSSMVTTAASRPLAGKATIFPARDVAHKPTAATTPPMGVGTLTTTSQIRRTPSKTMNGKQLL